MEFVVIWLLFGIFSAIFASQKNRSTLGWFLIGCLFGPFGLLVLAFPKTNDTPPDADVDASRMPEGVIDNYVESLMNKGIDIAYVAKRLNLSTEAVKDSVDRLWRSDRISHKAREAANRSVAKPDDETKKCPFCAESIKASAIKCRYCGSDL